MPAFYVAYQMASTDSNFVSRTVSSLISAKDKDDGKQENLHNAMLQQAISDSALLKGQGTSGRQGPPVRWME